nr:treacle protein isoform X1 [Nomia melanderi]XP_031847525.1 treacle protein isoform X1 [Nomia melanderi]XP_031847526.1 treacle protein isoform X1 [Nomia melanderi]XP_031847528.1 treacle protein isoform X1 [Nomia melanderi]
MSTQCNRFVQNAWKKELCSNCFKPREEHAPPEETLKLNIGRALHFVKTDSVKIQGILRGKATGQKDQKKKTVAFPECLTEIIGYGGDDFLSDADEDDEQDYGESFGADDDPPPDSEEERALGNLTRANTNFNTITAKLTAVVAANEASKSTSSTRSFASLMLGRIQKDSEGKKTTLLVSVTPFGGDETLPTARRPADRKINGFVNGSSSPAKHKINENGDKSETTLKAAKKPEADAKKDDRKDQKYSSMEKIVDLPLITSNNFIPVMQRNDEDTKEKSSADAGKPDKKAGSIARSPAIKKPDAEKPKIPAQSHGSKTEYCRSKSDSSDKGIELTLTPLTRSDAEEAAESDRSMLRGKEPAKIVVSTGNEDSSMEPRKFEEEPKKFSCEESRELAGEPDGKADEEEMTEPPALPRSPPPLIEARPILQADKPIIVTEPRPSFLHGAVNAELKVKPVVPQKPINFAKNPPADAKNHAKMQGGRSATGASGPQPQEQTSGPHPASKDKSDEPIADQLIPSNEIIPKDHARLPNTLHTQDFESSKPPESAPKTPGNSKPAPPCVARSPEVLDEDLDEEEGSESQVTAAESTRSNKRRMAPKPPADSVEELAPSSSLFARNPIVTFKSDSPVVREKEKRERASSCSPKFRKAVSDLPDPTNAQNSDPASRRTISLSQDSLTSGQEVREEKKRGRSRFSLKRFLRMGSRKDVDMVGGHASGSRIDEIPSTPQPKPRLEIIHPLELDGAAVEVVGNDRISRISEDQPDSCGNRNEARTTRSPLSSGASQAAVRPGKPPPPPRNQSLEDWSRLDPASKPVRPPPPRVETKQLPSRSDKSSAKSSSPSSVSSASSSSSSSSSWQPAASTTSDSIYANLAAEDVTGEVRSSLAPSKPQRTASMRDQATSQPILKKHGSSTPALNQDYDGVAVNAATTASDSLTSNDSHVYECLSSSPECDSSLELRHGVASHLSSKRKSDSNAMEAGAEFKFHQQTFARSTSLPYCGSETESELYAPYGFYTGDEGPEEDQDWKSKDDELRISRLRQRRGRSIVHRSLEDNYGAVVVANHEALAQFLEQLNQSPQVAAGLRALKNANPRISHFSIDTSTSITVGRRIFYSATWNELNVSLCVAFDLATHVSRKEFYLAPIIEFIDSVPKEITGGTCLPGNKQLEATISVLPRLQVSTIQSFGSSTKDMHDEGTVREASFVLLQFVTALKSLQARGIEESARSLSNVVLCREDKDAYYRLYLLQGLNVDTNEERDEERVSLCRCALLALQQLNLTSRLPLIQELLMREKAVTLSQVKSVLEFSLWGPADVTLGGPREREVTLQRWLDLERANVLHALVRTRSSLTVTDEYQLLFLVRTSAKIMGEASLLLDEQRSRLTRAR